jgi:arsenite methyltransferase
MRAIDCACAHNLEAADDVELLRLARERIDRDHPEMDRTDDQIRRRVAADAYDLQAVPERDFIFPTGRAWAEELDYPRPELSHVPDATVESFAGVANPWSLGRIEPGSVVLDLGCGAGTDLLIAAQMTGADGRVIGIDMTSSMLERARAGAEATGLANVELHHGLIEDLPLADESVDVVISNGVIDLVPDKDAVFAEIDRVLRPGGRLQLADVVIRTEVSEDARKRIDLWTG